MPEPSGSTGAQPSAEAIEAAAKLIADDLGKTWLFADDSASWGRYSGDDIAAMRTDFRTAARQTLRAAYAIDAPAIHAAGVEQGRAEAREEIERLRAQNKAHAERRDREQAEMQKRLAAFSNARDKARERMKHAAVDWTTDPPSQKPGGWWSYTSMNNVAEVAALVAELDEVHDEGRAAGRDEALREAVAWLRSFRTRVDGDEPHDSAMLTRAVAMKRAGDAIEAAFPTTGDKR